MAHNNIHLAICMVFIAVCVNGSLGASMSFPMGNPINQLLNPSGSTVANMSSAAMGNPIDQFLNTGSTVANMSSAAMGNPIDQFLNTGSMVANMSSAAIETGIDQFLNSSGMNNTNLGMTSTDMPSAITEVPEVGKTSNANSNASNATSKASNATSNTGNCTPQPLENVVLFYLYTQDNPTTYQQLYLNDTNSLTQSNFDGNQITQVLIHGLKRSSQIKNGMEQTIKTAFIDNNFAYNLILVDWSNYTQKCSDAFAANQTRAVGQFVGEFVAFLTRSSGASTSKVEMVGHNAGAHASGFAGKYLKSMGQMVNRITGLDPALTYFESALFSPSERLAEGDADFVQIIHTDGGCNGISIPIGNADFYPNGGEQQPGCGQTDECEPRSQTHICSVNRAFQYFAASINETNTFYAERCLSLADGEPGNCSGENDAQMGYYADDNLNGIFYLTTNTTNNDRALEDYIGGADLQGGIPFPGIDF